MKKTLINDRIPSQGFECFDWDALEEPKKAIKRRTQAAKSLDSISEAFALEYPDTVKSNDNNDSAAKFEIFPGKFIYVTVEDITIAGLKLSSEGIKEQIVNNDNLRDYPAFRNYLLQNNNRLIGVVKAVKNDKVYVDVLDAYYKLWLLDVEQNFIKKEVPLQIKDLELTRGGFIGKVDIWALEELTGVKWINTCFIPGSQIVLNVEQDFERWIGQTVMALPQKFTVFSTIYQRQDNCLVCSRKRLLCYEGAKYLEELYNRMQLLKLNKNENAAPKFTGKITGIIKTNNKCGVFIEIEDRKVTGMLPCETYELASFNTGDTIDVMVDRFEQTSERSIFGKNANGNIQWPNVHLILKKA